jgi:hypothetical protein
MVDFKKKGQSMKPFLEKIKFRPYWDNNDWNYYYQNNASLRLISCINKRFQKTITPQNKNLSG